MALNLNAFSASETFDIDSESTTVSAPFGRRLVLSQLPPLVSNMQVVSGQENDVIVYNGNYSYSGVGFANALATSGEDVNKKFKAVSSGKVYVSFLLNVSAAQDGGGYFFHLGPSTIDTVFRARVFIRKDADGYNIGISKSTANANYASERYVFGKTYNIVVKYTFNNATNTDDEVELFIEQMGCINPEPTAKIKALSNELDTKVDIGSIAIRQGSSTTAPTLRISNITVATDWDLVSRCNGINSIAIRSNFVFPPLNSSNDPLNLNFHQIQGIHEVLHPHIQDFL